MDASNPEQMELSGPGRQVQGLGLVWLETSSFYQLPRNLPEILKGWAGPGSLEVWRL